MSSALADPGDLDPDFGVGGLVTTDFGISDEDEATDLLLVEVGTETKIVAVGFAKNAAGNFDFALARYNEDGSLDTTFGTDGRVLTDFGGTADSANGATVDDDGKIIVVGSAEGPPNEFVFAVARYNADGSLDTTFGIGGLVRTSFPVGTFAEAEDVAIQDEYDDKIVVVGAAGEEFDPVEGEIVQPDFAIARYNEDGTLDTSFGTGGLVITDFSGSDISFDEAASVAIDDELIIAAGFSQADEDASEDFALARYNYDGSLDTTFGTGGLVTTDFDGDFDVIENIALQDGPGEEEDKIVAAGITVVDVNPITEEAPTEEDFALARYNEDGSLDLGFGTGGKVITDFIGGFDLATDVAIMGRRYGYKIVVVGVSADPDAASEDVEEDFAVALYNYDGSLDPAFGVGGLVRTDIAGRNEQASAVALDGDDIFAAGSTTGATTDEDFALALFEGD